MQRFWCFKKKDDTFVLFLRNTHDQLAQNFHWHSSAFVYTVWYVMVELNPERHKKDTDDQDTFQKSLYSFRFP